MALSRPTNPEVFHKHIKHLTWQKKQYEGEL
jgi:hypothetical protein